MLLSFVEGDVCVAASPGKCDDTVVSVHVVWTAETSRFVRVEGGQGSVCNLSLTDGSDMVGVTLLRELAGKLSKRLPYLFGAGQEADPSTFVRLVLKRSWWPARMAQASWPCVTRRSSRACRAT